MHRPMMFARPPTRMPRPAGGNRSANFTITLSAPTAADAEANAAAVAAEQSVVATSTAAPPQPVADELSAALLARLAPMVDVTVDAATFNRREQSLPRPRTGEIITSVFPPPEAPRPVDMIVDDEKAAPPPALVITRSTPTSDQELPHAVTDVSLTFNQPMIGLSTVDQTMTQSGSAPATITPQVAGEWRWIDPLTLSFKAIHRLPYATKFVVTVPAGTQSAVGGVMAASYSLTFTTAPLTIVSFLPNDVPETLRPIIVLIFNQHRISPEAVLAKTTLSAGGKQLTAAQLQLVPDADAIKQYEYQLSSLLPRTWFAFRPTIDVMKNTEYTVTLNRGCPSAEGPLTTANDQTHNFRTFPPLTLTSYYPDYRQTYNNKALPGQPWTMNFSNKLAHSSVSKDTIHCSPPIAAGADGAGFSIQHDIDSSSLTIHNQSAPSTSYNITVDPSLTDVYGQKVEPNQSCRFDTNKSPKPTGSMSGPSGLMTMDPVFRKNPTLPILVYNYHSLHVLVHQVEPTDYSPELPLNSTWSYLHDNTPAKLPGTKVFDHVLKCENMKRDEPMTVQVELDKYLAHQDEGVGHLLVVIEPTLDAWKQCDGDSDNRDYKNRPCLITWLQCTDLAVDVFDYGVEHRLTSWITNLTTGQPIPQATVAVAPYASQTPHASTSIKSTIKSLFQSLRRKSREEAHVEAPEPLPMTDESGLVSVDAASWESMVIAKRGNDTAFLPSIPQRQTRTDEWAWWTFTDRGLYKPKETVSIKGYIRKLQRDGAKCRPVYATGSVKYVVNDPRGSKLAEGTLKINEYGSFDYTIALPDNVNLGQCFIYYTAVGFNANGQQTFQVQEFRRPEYTVSSSYQPQTTHITHPTTPHSFTVSVNGHLFAGGSLTDASVRWAVTPQTSSFSSVHWSAYTFGKSSGSNWWRRYWSDDNDSVYYPTETLEGRTGSDGSNECKVTYRGCEVEPAPIAVSAVATVTDMNHQSQQSTVNVTVHPASVYVGHKIDRTYGKKGEPIGGSIVVCDCDGVAVGGVTVTVKIKGEGRNRTTDSRGLAVWTDVTDEQTLTLTSAVGAPPTAAGKDTANTAAVPFTFTPTLGGSYELTFTATDSEGRLAKSSYLSLYVSGGSATPDHKTATVKFVPVETLSMQLDKKDEYNVGDKCEVCCMMPFSPAQGLLQCFVRDTAVHTQRFSVEEGKDSVVLSVTIDPDWIPLFVVAVEVVGQTPRDESDSPSVVMRPAVAHGQTTVRVSLIHQKLSVQVTPLQTSEIARPGAHVSTSVTVTRADNQQAAGGVPVTIIMVDESVLSLTGYDLSDPLPLFYHSNATYVNMRHTRERCWLMNVEDAEALKKSMLAAAQARQEQADEALKYMPSRGRGAFGGAPMMKMAKMSMSAMMMPSPAMPAPPAGAFAMNSAAQPAQMDSLESMSVGGGGVDDSAMSNTAITLRTNFSPLAAFITHSLTDDNGVVSSRILLPDNITKYRVWAVAAAESDFGKGESQLTVSLPVMIRPSLPRFVNFGDAAYVTVVLQNQTETTLNVLVGMRSQNIRLSNESRNVYRVTLQPLQRLPVVWHVVADVSCGNARFQFAISTIDSPLDYSDAAEETIPIYTPCTTEAFAVYGDVAGAADVGAGTSSTATVIQPIVRPRDVITEFGGIDISCSTTILQSLTDAVIYLTSYPYDCNEQIASRILAVVSLYDVLVAFNSPQLPTPSEISKQLSADLNQLAQRQHSNGGWSWWSKWSTMSTEPYLSVHVIHALVVCQQHQPVNGNMLSSALSYCHNIKNHFHSWQSKRSRDAITAYAYYVLTKSGSDVTQKAQALLKETKLDDLELESRAWLLTALHGPIQADDKSTRKPLSAELNQVRSSILNHVVETAETVSFVTNYGDDGASVMLHSNRRTDAVILDAILFTDPTNNISPKIAKSILGHRTKGRWSSTQENSWCLLALNRYFNTFESVEPMLSAAIWLGDVYCGTQTFKGRSVDSQRVAIPMQTVVEQTKDTTDADNAIIIQRTGSGRLYYRIGLSYAPSSLRISAANYGFSVERSYAAVSPKDRCISSGAGVNREWHIGIGSLIRVTIKFTSRQRRYHVALCDYIPAGCEPVNNALRGAIQETPDSADTNANPWHYRWQWYEHTNTRDERVEAFTSGLSAGSYEYTFLMNATARGRFIVPPTKMEEMYSPEVFGRSNSEVVNIE